MNKQLLYTVAKLRSNQDVMDTDFYPDDPGFTYLDSLIRSSLFPGVDRGLPTKAPAWFVNYLINQNL